MEPEDSLPLSQGLPNCTYPQSHQIQPTSSCPTSARSLLILFTHIHLGLSSGVFCSGFPTNNPCVFPFSAIHAACPAHLIFPNLILGEEYRSQRSSFCSFLHTSVTSSLFSPDIFLSTQFLNILNLCSSLSVRHQVSHPYRTTGKIMVVYILIFKFFESR
jgi:hypothetical protein